MLDITYAFVFHYLRSGLTPVRILQSVASGMLGADAFKGGLPTAALGLFFHFLIAFHRRRRLLRGEPQARRFRAAAFVCGMIYGVFIYAFMNYVVLPLSAAPFKGNTPAPSRSSRACSSTCSASGCQSRSPPSVLEIATRRGRSYRAGAAENAFSRVRVRRAFCDTLRSVAGGCLETLAGR